MKVYKFGGAAIKDADSIKNVVSILKKKSVAIVVFSAMGKMTNAFEKLTDAYYCKNKDVEQRFGFIKNFHDNIIDELFEKRSEERDVLEALFTALNNILQLPVDENHDFVYDKIVSFGEKISTTILSLYLSNCGIENVLLDACKVVRTNSNFREGSVDFDATQKNFNSVFKKDKVNIIQGFVGGTETGDVVTLGREGSDYSAAIMGAVSGAESVTIWKDVAGILNCDPCIFNQTKKFDSISYHEAIELAYYGAKVIHHKTIKPLQNSNITLLVKSFIHPDKEGTVINKGTDSDDIHTSYILKSKQVLLSISTRDFSFIAEENLHTLYGVFSVLNIKINMMQHSAITTSVCFDYNESKLKSLLNRLKEKYHVRYNSDLQLVTIRHYNEESINKMSAGKKILLEQRSRKTVQLVVQ
ncbi:MAG: aspartate kinase [Bacteroidota bacterium]|nr:aspartate kinase [Bacteroidota bacterium]